ncbi:tryptophan-rich sensory protein [Neptunitalea lumnitzerae]|uniref:Tryptophan-rich sensory protein n=1 Tax=Neptunitalea lumnitzerae TaxID=2965509 RepID=A0ABQ5MG55_9FLAO|nr:tryptophan-rich sensory protein [Neptunitalea sp. Y10]GLB48369.1 hypothetical protein Y10_07370 [Neptunitalea sp. Y10]
MAKRFAIQNFISVVIAIFIGYYTQAIQLNGNTMASLSKEYYNLFTPANYAFAIWGIIYIALLVFSIYHLVQVFAKKKLPQFLLQTGNWFFIANIANAAWVVVWLLELTGVSVIIMLILLFSLIKIILNTNMERWNAPAKTIGFNWWPICIYSGWVTVATVANIAAYLSKLGWHGGPLSEENWTLIMIVVAVIINILAIYKRNMREFGLVGVWTLIAIYMRHSDTYNTIAYTALAGAIIIFLYASYHGFKNRKSNPFIKKVS